jgi:hypothetical protein
MLATFPNSSVVVPDLYAPDSQVLVNFSNSEAGRAALKELLKDVRGPLHIAPCLASPWPLPGRRRWHASAACVIWPLRPACDPSAARVAYGRARAEAWRLCRLQHLLA